MKFDDKIRGVREAERKGWHTVQTKGLNIPNCWNKLTDWLDVNCKGPYKESFTLQTIAFKEQRDANWFALRWL